MIAVALLLVAAAAAAQALPAPTTSFTHEGRSFYQDDAGQYTNSELSNTGTVQNDRGYLKQAADGTLVLVREGNVAYTSPEGVPVQISYTADEYGYHPTGNALPVAPVPQVVQRFF